VTGFFHILRLIYFSDNVNQPDKNDSTYGCLWKMRTLFDQLCDAYAKFYSPSEHLAVDEVIVLYKHYIRKKHEHFGVNINKLCDMTDCT